MATLDSYIANTTSRIQFYANAAYEALYALDFNKVVTDFDRIELNPEQINTTFNRPAADTTPFPVYEQPGVAEPVQPTLVNLPGVNSPVLPTAPDISSRASGLFQNNKPTNQMPLWDEQVPDLHIDEIYQELVALSDPVLATIALPVITPITVGNAPTLTLPSYQTNAAPAELNAPTNYATYWKNQYDAALPVIQNFVDSVVDRIITKFAPTLYSQIDVFDQKVADGMNGEILTDEFETRLYQNDQSRVAEAYADAELSILNNPSRGVGMVIAPGGIASALAGAKLSGMKVSADNSNKVYIERRRTEVEYSKFILGLASANINFMRGQALDYARVGIEINQEARNQAQQLTANLVQLFEHEKSRSEFSIALLRIIDDQYKTKLTAALSGLEGFKTQLEAYRLTKDIDQQQIDLVKSQADLKQLEINHYSAMVDAIAKRTSVTQGYINEMELKAKVFEVQTKATIATFDLYRSMNEGDESKLKGLMAEIEVYDSQLKAINTSVGVEVAVLDGQLKTNEARNNQYKIEADVYQTLYDVALKKFTSEATIKEIGMNLYKTNVETELEIYKGELGKQFKYIDAQIAAFKGNIDSLKAYYDVEINYGQLDLNKAAKIADVLGGIAQSSASALGGNIALSENV